MPRFKSNSYLAHCFIDILQSMFANGKDKRYRNRNQ